MVATVGSISIDLSTNAAKFATGFKSAATTVEQQSSRMAKSVALVDKGVTGVGLTLKNFGAGLAAGAGLTALASLGGAFDKLKETISEYDKIASDAKTTGLKTDTFQALAFAAKQANIEYDSFNSSLDIFAKNSGLAAKGQGALYSGLKNLNPQLLQNILNTKDQEERLKLVADAMANTTDATQKAALATTVFGKGGIEMARILEQGRDSIDRLKKAALDLGIIIPDDLLQKAGELDDKLDALSTVISAQLGQSLINLAPILIGAIQGFADFSKELNSTSSVIDNFINNPSLANFGKIFGEGSIKNGLDGLAESSHRSTAAIQADIDEVTQRLADLKIEAKAGFDVGLSTDRALDELKGLQDELRRTGIAASAAANNASGAFDDLLKSMGDVAAAASNPLPTVHRYGGDPNKITLPQFNSQSNVNGTGVGVTSYGGNPAPGFGAGPQSNVNGSGVRVTSYGAPDPGTKETADNTLETADNVSTLDTNTKGYLRGLSNDIGGYSSQTNITISKLSDVVRANIGGLSSSILSLLVAGGGPGKAGGIGGGAYAFGDSYDPQYGSYISSWGVGKTTRPTVNFPSTSDGGNYNQAVSVAQPGSSITLNYNAAAGESTQTAKQNALAMYHTLVAAAASQ